MTLRRPDARACDVWPWLIQVGYGRAGFCNYDLLDNLGRPSATAIMPQWQRADVGDPEHAGGGEFRVEAVRLDAGERGIPAALAGCGARLVSCTNGIDPRTE